MGLDMYVFTTDKPPATPVDFPEPKHAFQLHYWRKHPNLHGWMQKLYEEKGGADRDFDLAPVVLVAADLDRLEADIKAKQLPQTAGFFFGCSDGDEHERADDLAFVQKARAAIAMSLTVYYVAWW